MKISINKTRSVRSCLDWNKRIKIKNNNIVIIKIRDKGKLIGCCYIKVNSNFIWNLVINPKYRNQGYGKKLLSVAEKEIKRNGCTSSRITPQDNDANLRRYYSNLGYKGYSENEKGYEEEDKNWWVMEKIFKKT